MEQYSPSDHLEAKEKFEKREEGKEEAKFYAAFISEFKEQVYQGIYENGHIGRSLMKDSQDAKKYMESIGNDNLNMQDAIGSALMTEAKEKTLGVLEESGMETPKDFKIDTDKLLTMTAGEFFDYLDAQKASLIK